MRSLSSFAAFASFVRVSVITSLESTSALILLIVCSCSFRSASRVVNVSSARLCSSVSFCFSSETVKFNAE
ncbi:hypothetical protein J3Q64DRAFT_1746351 [Phycomyces blakesleeanus]|uniref:Secreted protein n=1 Tax=Phycomyces blakesleeanus TaxID=4837 RepID=A0ABR3AYL3_PHYBL